MSTNERPVSGKNGRRRFKWRGWTLLSAALLLGIFAYVNYWQRVERARMERGAADQYAHAMSKWQDGDYAAAEPALRNALTLVEGLEGKESNNTVNLLANLATCLREQERHGEAADVYREAIRRSAATRGENHRDTMAIRALLAECLEKTRPTPTTPLPPARE